MPARWRQAPVHDTTDETVDAVHVPRVLPDYTWPVHVPPEVLRRQIAAEFNEARELVRALFPHWDTAR